MATPAVETDGLAAFFSRFEARPYFPKRALRPWIRAFASTRELSERRQHHQLRQPFSQLRPGFSRAGQASGFARIQAVLLRQKDKSRSETCAADRPGKTMCRRQHRQ